jgi:molecular chaperone DnaK
MTAVSKWSLGFASRTGDYIVMIPKGSPLPARRSVTVTTAVDSQPDMKLAVYMGESEKAEENYPMSNIRLDCIEKGAAGASRIKLTFYAYEHSVFRIGVCYKEGDPEQDISIIPATGLSEENMNRMREMINKMTAQVTPQEVEGQDLGVIPLSVMV